MSGAGFFFAFAMVAFPAACLGLIGLRRQVLLWLWLERQWKARQAMVASRGTGKRKRRSAVLEQIVLFPEVTAPRNDGPIKVLDCSGGQSVELMR